MGIAAVALIGAILPVGPARLARAQGAQAQTQKKAKDQGEYDLFVAANKETDPARKIAILNEWKQKYPESDYKLDRLKTLMQTYSDLQQWSNVVNAGKEALAIDPKYLSAMYWITNAITNMNSTAAGDLAIGEKAANGLLAAERPANIKEEMWVNAKRGFDVTAHRTLGWIAMKRQSNVVAEQEFIESLKLDRTQAYVSYWLGGVIVAERKPERYSEAIYDFARAVAYEGPGALTPELRTTADSYLTTVYVQYHGDNSGLDGVKAAAKASALAPAGFRIASKAEISAQKPGLGPVYANAQDADERLQLNASNRSFSLREGGQDFNGTYAVNGSVLRLHIAQLQKDVDIAIDGSRLIVNGAEIWIQPTQPAPAGPAPSEPPPQQQPAQQMQPDQGSDGVWLGFYGTCPRNEGVIFKPTIYANQVELAKLACNTYFYVAARPGTYKLCATKGHCTTAAVGSNGPYYFRVLPTTLSYSIGQVDASVAQDELGRHRMTALDLGRVLAPKMVTTSTDTAPSVFLSPQ